MREYMNQAGARLDSLTDLPPEISSHLTSCTSCLADRRVAWLRKRETTGAAVAADAPSRGRRAVVWMAILLALVAAWFFSRRT